MNKKKKKEFKSKLDQERIYRHLSQSSAKELVDLFTFKTKLVKQKVVDSGNKFDLAVEELQRQGRVIIKGKNIMVNPNGLMHGTLIITGSKGYILLDKDNHQYGIDLKDIYGVKSNEKVVVGFSIYDSGSRIVPFVVCREDDFALDKQKEKSSDDSIKKPSIIENRVVDDDVIYGRVMKIDHDNLVFIPNSNSRYKKNIMILNDKKTWAKYQDKICTMRIVSEGDEKVSPAGIILDIKGDAGNPIVEYDTIAESHGANMSWSDEKVLKEIQNIPTEVDLSKFTFIDENGKVVSGNGRESIVDLRHLPFTTTDPATCKDMDDAIYSTYDEQGNLVVYTAVANVSKYVDLNSEIGQRYIKGAFTTYAPNKAYNILPPELSTNICSLNPNVDRLAFVVKTTVDSKTGLPISSKIMDAIIQSHEKYSYEQAQEICDNSPQITEKLLKAKILNGEELSKDEQVVMNEQAADILWRGFNQRDLIEFNTSDEYDIKFSENMDNIVEISTPPHVKYHKVIEAFMLTANEASAQFAESNGIANVYRVHGEPNEGKVEQAEEFFGYMGIPFDGDLSPTSIKKILDSVKGTNYEKVVNNFLVRMQSKAKYNTTTNPEEVGFISSRARKKRTNTQRKNIAEVNYSQNKKVEDMASAADSIDERISHFGLQSKHYSHTTSPIRRITDYITHYNILAFMHGEPMLDESFVRDICMWANQMQDENDEAEREFQAVNSAIYCEGHIGDVMKGYVCGFRKMNDSKFATLDDLRVVVENEEKGIKVLIPVSEILQSKGISTKNIAISPYGSAIINRENKKPIIKLCSPISFKITQSNRITRQVEASTNLEQEAEISDTSLIDSSHTKVSKYSQQASLKRERMQANRAYKIASVKESSEKESMRSLKGAKSKSDYEKRNGGYIEPEEALKADKQKSRERKQKLYKIKEDELDFDIDSIEDENDDE